MKLWFESSLFAPCVDLLVRLKEVSLLSALYRDAFNEIGVVNIKNADVLVTFVGDPWEFASLVAGDESFGVLD